MKEATGELNMTVVTVVAVAALAGFFYLVIWPVLQKSMTLSSACNASNGGMMYYNQKVDGKDVVCKAGSGQCTYDNSTRSCENSGAAGQVNH